MGTLTSVVEKVRIRIREKYTHFFSDEDFISLANDLLDGFYDDMRNHECKKLVTTVKTTLVEGTTSYALSDKDSIVFNHVLTDGYAVIPQYDARFPDRLSYLETDTGINFYNHTGQDVYISYWQARPTALTDIGDTIPWDGEWDQALLWSLVLETKDIRQFKINTAAVRAHEATSAALTRMVEKYGTISRILKGSYV